MNAWQSYPSIILANDEVVPVVVAIENSLLPKIPLNDTKGETSLIINNVGNSPFTLSCRASVSSGDLQICRMVKGQTFDQTDFREVVNKTRADSDRYLVTDAAKVNKTFPFQSHKFKCVLGVYHSLANLKRVAVDMSWSIDLKESSR